VTNKIKSALEIALEKVNKINKLTPEEREKIRDHEKINIRTVPG